MIQGTRFDDSIIYFNPDNIESIEKTPDTIITLSSGKKIMVKETPEALVTQFINYKKTIHQGLQHKIQTSDK